MISGLCSGLSSAGNHVTLMTGECDENEIDYLEINGVDPNVQIVRIPGLGRSVSLLTDLTSFYKIRKTMKKLEPDIVHTHTSKAGLLGRLASLSLLRGQRRVHTYHGHLLYGYFSNHITTLIVFLESLLSKVTHCLISVGEQVRKDLLARNVGTDSRFEVIAPGIQLSVSKFESKQIPHNAFTIAWVGRLVEIKRPERIIEIARALRRRNLDFTIRVIGGGPLFDVLQIAKIREKLPVVLEGWRHDAIDYMKASDVIILTSDNEGTPITLIEAQLLGKPVIATNVGSVAETFLDSKSGFLVQYDAEVFADRIELLAKNRDLYESFAQSAADFASKQFSIQQSTAKHLALYAKLLKN